MKELLFLSLDLKSPTILKGGVLRRKNLGNFIHLLLYLILMIHVIDTSFLWWRIKKWIYICQNKSPTHIDFRVYWTVVRHHFEPPFLSLKEFYNLMNNHLFSYIKIYRRLVSIKINTHKLKPPFFERISYIKERDTLILFNTIDYRLLQSKINLFL